MRLPQRCKICSKRFGHDDHLHTLYKLFVMQFAIMTAFRHFQIERRVTEFRQELDTW